MKRTFSFRKQQTVSTSEVFGKGQKQAKEKQRAIAYPWVGKAGAGTMQNENVL